MVSGREGGGAWLYGVSVNCDPIAQCLVAGWPALEPDPGGGAQLCSGSEGGRRFLDP